MYVPENDQSAGTAPTAAPLPDVKPREGEPYEAFIARRAEAGAASSAYSPGIGFAMCGERCRGLRVATQITAQSQFEGVGQTEEDERTGHDQEVVA